MNDWTCIQDEGCTHTANVNVPILEDDKHERDEKFRYYLDNTPGTTSLYHFDATRRIATILDNDPLGVVDAMMEVSSTPTGGYYDADDSIEFTVPFNGSVTVTGTPQLTFDLGGQTRQANYTSGSDTEELLFTYTVTASDADDHDGISWGANALGLNGGTIKFTSAEVSAQVAADLAHAARGPLPAHKVLVRSPTRTESSESDFPYSDETWGFVDTSASSSGTLDATHDSRRRTGDWWKLRVEPHRRYRVQVQFGSTTSQATGGGIDVNYNDAWWDHNRDDGLAFIEFTTISEPHYLRVRARDFLRDFLNEGPATYHGPYTVTLTDITGITRKVSNRSVYSGDKVNVTSGYWRATSFTTGSNTGGYKLSYVGTGLYDVRGTNSVEADLYTDSSGSPGTKIIDFQRVGEITGHPTAQRSDRFWAPFNAANLTASTTYWVVFKENNSGVEYNLTQADSGVDSGTTGEWSIGDSVMHYSHGVASPSWSTQATEPNPILLEIFASNVVTGAASEAVDQTAPQLQSATVDGSTLTLVYDEALDVTDTPPLSAFTVNVGGSPRQVIAAAVGEYNVLLFLSPPVEAGEAVTVDYTAPADEAAGRVRDTSGNAAASFSGQAVTNNMQVLDRPEDTVPDFSRFREALRNNSTATGEPAITGTAAVGETLTADTSGISDADGMTSAGFSYQWLADDDDISGAEGSSYVLPEEDEGREIKVRVSFTDDAGNAETVTSAATAAVAATSVGGQETPLTASAHNAPSSHDGNTVFTFELRFSETPREGFSYKTLHDNAFTVTGGEVVKARRLEKGRNVRWEISVTPDGNGPVTIVLPATTDCEADGAVCTDDGRKLSQALEFEVPGLSTPEISLNTPEITSGSSFSVDEGATQVATLRATDGDTPAANLTWSISGGDDEAKFAVTAAGALSFAAAKDYETPDDAGADGVYEVTVQVSDGGRTDSADLTVTLTNVNEAPTADAGANQENVAQGDTVTLNGSGTDPDAGEVFSFAWVQTSGATVTLSDTAAALPTFTAPTGQTSAAELIFTLRVTDDEGLFAEDSVTVAITGQLPLTPLTASARDLPASHDGNTAFTFELRFSEEFAISYKTLRDNAFTVTGGEVVKARRLEKGRNVRWEISVRPDGNGAVTTVLPATTDCTAQGAVCTDDGRMLSNRLAVTVPGPGG